MFFIFSVILTQLFDIAFKFERDESFTYFQLTDFWLDRVILFIY